MTRRARYKHGKVDKNQTPLLDLWRRLGGQGISTSMVGGDFPDTVLGLHGVTVLGEVKKPGEDLTPGQGRFHRDWKGGPIVTLATEQDVHELQHGIVYAGVKETVELASWEIASDSRFAQGTRRERYLAAREITEALAAAVLKAYQP